MNYLLRFCIVSFVLVSCSKPSELSKEFNCESTILKNTILKTDFKKNFRLYIPSSWKSELYYDSYASELFAADTTKQLLETYILNASYNLGEVVFNDSFLIRNDSIALSNELKIIKSKKINFKSKEGYYSVSKGFKNNFPYHNFILTVKISENGYFNSSVEIYGENKIEERICEAIGILNKIEFLQ